MIAKDELVKVKKSLDNGDVIAFPTETVMGLGVLYNNENAYDKLNKIKRRPEDKPYTMMLGRASDISKYAKLSHRDEIIINEFMPGPLTVLLNAKDNVPGYVTHNTGIIGIRVPGFKEICEMINYVNEPLLVPSANRSGSKPLSTYKDVKNEFNDELGYIIEMDSNNEKPSTIIDLTGKEIKIIREGNISLDDINRRLYMKRIVVGCDHGGLEYKNAVANHLKDKGFEVIDVGTNSLDSCHYPEFAFKAAEKVANHEADYGIVICTTGEGICIAANKVKGARCGLGYCDEASALMRQHNDANMIAFGQKYMKLDDVLRRVDIFLSSDYENSGRHLIRVQMIKDFEK